MAVANQTQTTSERDNTVLFAVLIAIVVLFAFYFITKGDE